MHLTRLSSFKFSNNFFPQQLQVSKPILCTIRLQVGRQPRIGVIQPRRLYFTPTKPVNSLFSSWGSFTNRVSTILTGPKKPEEQKKDDLKADANKQTTKQEPESEKLDSHLARERGDKKMTPELEKDEEDLKAVETKILQQGSMDLEDYRLQLSKSTKVANYAKLLKYVPGTSQYQEQLKTLEGAMGFVKSELAILEAMTIEERRNPDLLIERGFKRRQRVSQDSKCSLEEVNRVLDRFRLTREAFAFMSEHSKTSKEPLPKDQEAALKFIMNNPAFLKRFKKLKINPSVLMDVAAGQTTPAPGGAPGASGSRPRVTTRSFDR